MAGKKNDERYDRVIDLYLEGKNIVEISKITTVSRPTIYRILDEPYYKAMIDKRLHDLQTQGQSRLQNKLGAYIDELEVIAMTGDSENIKSQALQYLINRILGSPTSKVQDITDKDNTNDVNIDDIRSEFTKFKVVPSEDILQLNKAK